MENTKEIFTDEIILPKENMREYIDRDEIFALGEDIKKNGLINPITVRPKDGKFELVAGQRRYLAHQVMGLIKINCVVRELSNDEALAIQTSENLARVDVNPLDEAKHISRLDYLYNHDYKQVAHIAGRSINWVMDRLAINEMPDYMQEMIGKKEIKLGVALVLAQITDESTRKMWVFQAVRDGVTVEMANYWLADFKRRLLPGGELDTTGGGANDFAPPPTIMFRCAIDGKEYDVRLCKTIIIYEGNLEYFNAFVSEFRRPSD